MFFRETINSYGDKIIDTTGRHGSDIASQRVDDLDRKCVEYALSLGDKESFSVDIGCGFGAQGVRLATMGSETLLIDILDISETLESLSRLLGINNLTLLVKDAREITVDDIPKAPDIVFSQRFIHYLKYEEAQSLISIISQKMPAGSRLFISASGLLSELGNGYLHKKMAIDKRFCGLDIRMARKHRIYAPVCLYTESELQGLIEPFGFASIEVWSSSFGNIKAIFERR